MKLVDPNQAKEFAATIFGDPILKMAVNAVMDNVPKVEASEVVFCEICRHSRETERAGYLFCNNPCGMGRGVIATDFCSDGERKSDE